MRHVCQYWSLLPQVLLPRPRPTNLHQLVNWRFCLFSRGTSFALTACVAGAINSGAALGQTETASSRPDLVFNLDDPSTWYFQSVDDELISRPHLISSIDVAIALETYPLDHADRDAILDAISFSVELEEDLEAQREAVNQSPELREYNKLWQDLHPPKTVVEHLFPGLDFQKPKKIEDPEGVLAARLEVLADHFSTVQTDYREAVLAANTKVYNALKDAVLRTECDPVVQSAIKSRAIANALTRGAWTTSLVPDTFAPVDFVAFITSDEVRVLIADLPERQAGRAYPESGPGLALLRHELLWLCAEYDAERERFRRQCLRLLPFNPSSDDVIAQSGEVWADRQRSADKYYEASQELILATFPRLSSENSQRFRRDLLRAYLTSMNDWYGQTSFATPVTSCIDASGIPLNAEQRALVRESERRDYEFLRGAHRLMVKIHGRNGFLAHVADGSRRHWCELAEFLDAHAQRELRQLRSMTESGLECAAEVTARAESIAQAVRLIPICR